MKGDKLTLKQDRFCLNLFEGMSQREAYIKAGYSDKAKPGVLDRNAYALANRNYILSRLDELKKKAEDDSVATVKERKQFLTKVIRSDLKTPDTTLAQSITTRITEAGNKIVKVEYPSKLSAVAELNKMENIGVHGTDININLVLQKIVTKLEVNDMDYSKLTREELKLLAYGEESEGE